MAIAVLITSADMAKITPTQHNTIHRHTFKPALKLREKSNMHHLHKIDEAQAKTVIKKETNEDVQELKLTHSGRVLFYKATTKNYLLQVNALDGTIMSKEKKQ